MQRKRAPTLKAAKELVLILQQLPKEHSLSQEMALLRLLARLNDCLTQPHLLPEAVPCILDAETCCRILALYPRLTTHKEIVLPIIDRVLQLSIYSGRQDPMLPVLAQYAELADLTATLYQRDEILIKAWAHSLASTLKWVAIGLSMHKKQIQRQRPQIEPAVQIGLSLLKQSESLCYYNAKGRIVQTIKNRPQWDQMEAILKSIWDAVREVAKGFSTKTSF